jgi:hypothetical protein
MKRTLLSLALLMPLWMLAAGCRSPEVAAPARAAAPLAVVVEGLVPFTDEDLFDFERRVERPLPWRMTERSVVAPANISYPESRTMRVRIFGMRLPDSVAACRGCPGCVLSGDSLIGLDLGSSLNDREERPQLVLPLLLTWQEKAVLVHWRRFLVTRPPDETAADTAPYRVSAQYTAF